MALVLNDDQALLLRSALGYLMAVCAAYEQETGQAPDPATEGAIRLAMARTHPLAEAVWQSILRGDGMELVPRLNTTLN